MITPEPPAGSEHYREGWRHGYEQAAIDRERSTDAVRLVPESEVQFVLDDNERMLAQHASDVAEIERLREDKRLFQDMFMSATAHNTAVCEALGLSYEAETETVVAAIQKALHPMLMLDSETGAVSLAGAVPDTGQVDEVLKLRWEVQQLQGMVQDQHRAIAAVRSLCADAMKLPTLEDPRPADDRVSPRAVLAALDRAGSVPDTGQACEPELCDRNRHGLPVYATEDWTIEAMPEGVVHVHTTDHRDPPGGDTLCLDAPMLAAIRAAAGSSGDSVQASESPTDSTTKAGRWGSGEVETATGAVQARETGADWAARPRRFTPEDTLSVAERLGAAEPSGGTVQAPDVAAPADAFRQAIIAAVGPGEWATDRDLILALHQWAEDQAAEAVVRQTRLKGITVEDGIAELGIESPRELVIAWVWAAREMLGEAPNYSETRIDFPKAEMEVKAGGEVDRYVFTVQRAGKVTPHEARLAAEADRDAALAEVDRLRALLGTDATPDRLAWISEAGETAAAQRQARYQETACARRYHTDTTPEARQ